MPVARVTIVIPTRNRLELLKEALASVEKQSYPEYRILVVDNASTDATPVYMASIQDSRITYHRHDQEIGMAANWRFGVTKPDTDYIAFLHDDDRYHPEFLLTALRRFEENPAASYFSCAVQHFGSVDYVQRPYGLPEATPATFFAPVETLAIWLGGFPAQCSGSVVRRDALGQVDWGPEGALFTLDYYIFGQAALHGGWIYDPTILSFYRHHDASDTHRNWQRGCRTQVQILWVAANLAASGQIRGVLDGGLVVRRAATWTLHQRAGLVLALANWANNRGLRHLAAELLRVYPDILESVRTSRHCRVARYVGEWYLGLAALLVQIASGWWQARWR